MRLYGVWTMFKMTGKYIVDYIRRTQSSQTLQLALSEIANLRILEHDSVLNHIHQDDRNTVYTFDKETIVVTYPHVLLSVGELYPAGKVIGEEYIKVYSREAGASEQWWRVLDWSNGLPITGPFEGLVIPDRLVRYYWVSDWTDSNSNTRKHIRCDFDTTDMVLLDKFWYQIHQAEENSEITLVDLDSLEDVDDGTDVRVNMLDLYFRELFGDRGVVVDLRTDELGDKIHRAVKNFIKRETPVGGIILLREGIYAGELNY